MANKQKQMMKRLAELELQQRQLNVADNQATIEQTPTIAAEARAFSGPIPPPDMLVGYAQVSPDFPNRILAMTESQMAHRHLVEREVVMGRNRAVRFSTICATAIALGALGLAGYALHLGHPGAAVGIVGADIAGLASTAWITKRKKNEPIGET